jgi:hypothetical protein
MNKTEELLEMATTQLANELVENWKKNLTLSGYLAFVENEKEKETIFAWAEELGISDDVYKLASKIMNGEA